MGDYRAPRDNRSEGQCRLSGHGDSARNKAREELESLYRGVPDECVDLTFSHLIAGADPNTHKPKENMERFNKKVTTDLEDLTLSGESQGDSQGADSLDFTEGLRAVKSSLPSMLNDGEDAETPKTTSYVQKHKGHQSCDEHSPTSIVNGHRRTQSRSVSCSEVMGVPVGNTVVRGGHRKQIVAYKRPGIPHSNICANCNCYVFIFKHRCLVCGRVYCRQCVKIGMGRMEEGRKCIACLGHRFSQRYIHKAGAVGCFTTGKQLQMAELKWAEMGPKRLYGNTFSRVPVSLAHGTPFILHGSPVNMSRSSRVNPGSARVKPISSAAFPPRGPQSHHC